MCPADPVFMAYAQIYLGKHTYMDNTQIAVILIVGMFLWVFTYILLAHV